MDTQPPRTIDVCLHLLDRQVVTTDGRLVCKVDDLELTPDRSGRLFVTAILVGPRALAPRFGGRLGRWMAAIAARLTGGDPRRPPRIDIALVSGIDSSITVDAPAGLDVAPLERWVDRFVIAPIPGSRDAG